MFVVHGRSGLRGIQAHYSEANGKLFQKKVWCRLLLLEFITLSVSLIVRRRRCLSALSYL